VPRLAVSNETVNGLKAPRPATVVLVVDAVRRLFQDAYRDQLEVAEAGDELDGGERTCSHGRACDAWEERAAGELETGRRSLPKKLRTPGMRVVIRTTRSRRAGASRRPFVV